MPDQIDGVDPSVAGELGPDGDPVDRRTAQTVHQHDRAPRTTVIDVMDRSVDVYRAMLHGRILARPLVAGDNNVTG